jgi:hypothetical protein
MPLRNGADLGFASGVAGALAPEQASCGGPSGASWIVEPPGDQVRRAARPPLETREDEHEGSRESAGPVASNRTGRDGGRRHAFGGAVMLIDAVSLATVGAACWFIYRFSPGVGDANAMPVRGASRRPYEPVAWPERRRFFLARVLRTPMRHLASVTEDRGGFHAACVCGWRGDRHSHQGDAFADAHIHTRHVHGVIRQRLD